MELDQNESSGLSFDPDFTGDRDLTVCPYLGLVGDPSTSLAFPHQSNLCHRPGKPVEIGLLHQSGFCLSGKHASCQVFLQAVDASSFEESPRKRFSLVLPTADRLVPVIRTRLDSLKLRWLSLRLGLLLFKLRLRSRVKGLVGNLPAVRAVRSNGDMNPLASAHDQQAARDEMLRSKLGSYRFSQAGLRLLAIPTMLLLILLAAIIWWPPPGETERDAVVAGATILKNTSLDAGAHGDETSAALQDDRVQEHAGALSDAADQLSPNPITSSADDQPAQIAVGSALSDAAEGDTPAVLSQPAAEDSEGNLAPDESAANAPAESTVGQASAETDAAEGAALEPEQITESAAATAEQVEDDDAGTAQGSAPAAADVSGPLPALPAAAIVAIGPDGAIQGPQDVYQSSGPLFLYAAPGEDAVVVAQISVEQPATILGRDGSGEWILVRLRGGIQGWANVDASGVDIPISNLPAVDAILNTPDASAITESAAPALPESSEAVVNIGALNLRAGPGVEFDPIGVVFNKEEVALLGQPGSNGWVQVQLANGLVGWLNSTYLILPG